eukprot:CAMPEP_0184493492 /NCGR_PEP_ID=MMETSP0113_2-20130426/26131_1 /TAXON_ID=91329 /ORGANISM="Norrisiella sphaerica, Strain BC52" /LENGTH=217 /DNA_ID=CAMNT_0026878757 /DNA_START=29 /DNA_END=678 /DNA_ORIENTATION=+
MRGTYRKLGGVDEGDLEAKGQSEGSLQNHGGELISPAVDCKRHDSNGSLHYFDGVAQEFPELYISFLGLTCKVQSVDNETKEKFEKTILSNLSGTFIPGSLNAIMGPSGGGKTTLLDCLAGKKTLHYSGKIFVNGHERTLFFQRVIGYCPQESELNANLTVRESLTFCARLKAQHDDEGRITKTVNWVLDALSLTEVSEQRIGNVLQRGISGGQKRR